MELGKLFESGDRLFSHGDGRLDIASTIGKIPQGAQRRDQMIEQKFIFRGEALEFADYL